MEDSPKTSLLSLSSLCPRISQVMQLDANGYVDVFVVVDNGHVVVDNSLNLSRYTTLFSDV